MEASEIELALRSQLDGIFQSITVLEQIDSTNAEAMRRMQALQESSQLIVALSQSAGRGRRGRQWLSPPGAGIYLSITRTFERPLAELQALSLMTALSVAEAISSCGVEGVKLKWPNDVLVGRKKLAGILLETCQNDERPVIIFGIGINLDLPDSIVEQLDRPVTDVSRERSEGSEELNPVDLLGKVCRGLDAKLDEFLRTGFVSFRGKWNEMDDYLGEEVVIINGEQRLTGVCAGVDEQGALVLNEESGSVRTINGGEVFPSLRSAQQDSEGKL